MLNISFRYISESRRRGSLRVGLIPVRNYLDDSYRYTFGGKEEQPELGLNWMDFHARNYMPDLGRWMSPDPLAEEYPSWSPYNYVYNNPLNFKDFSGMCPDGDCPDDPPDIYGGVLDEVVITNEPTGSGFINLQNRFAGSMDEWQQLTKEVFSSDNELADLQWQVSYGNAEQEFFQAQLDEQTSAQHRATSRAAELTMYVLPTPIVGLGALSKVPILYRSAMKSYKISKAFRITNPNALNKTLPGFTDKISGSALRQGRTPMVDFLTHKPPLPPVNTQGFSKVSQLTIGGGLSGLYGYYLYRKEISKK